MPTAPSKQSEPGVRTPVKWGVILLLVLGVSIFAWRQWGPAPAPAEPSDATPVEEPSQAVEGPPTDQPTAANPVPAGAAPSSDTGQQVTATAPTTEPAIAVDPSMGGLVAGLRNLAGTNAVLTPEATAAWQTNFLRLVQAGPVAVPALKAFLDHKVDATFGNDAWQGLGLPLSQAGGPRSTPANRRSGSGSRHGKCPLHNPEPAGNCVLARNLEEASPGSV